MSTMNKYVKKHKPRQEDGEVPANEIRLTGTNFVGKYITYAATKLLDKEKPVDFVTLKATGVAAKGACLVAEILKHRIKNLHQVNEIKTITVFDEYEPLEEGLDHVKIERNLAVLEIHLSRKDGVLDTKAPGYQKPIPESEVEEEDLAGFLERAEGRGRAGGYERRGGRGTRRGGRLTRGRGRGGRGGRPRDQIEDEDHNEGRVRTTGGERYRRAPREGEGEVAARRRGYDRDRGSRRGGERQHDRNYDRRPQNSQGGRRINQPK